MVLPAFVHSPAGDTGGLWQFAQANYPPAQIFCRARPPAGAAAIPDFTGFYAPGPDDVPRSLTKRPRKWAFCGIPLINARKKSSKLGLID